MPVCSGQTAAAIEGRLVMTYGLMVKSFKNQGGKIFTRLNKLETVVMVIANQNSSGSETHVNRGHL